MKKALSNVVCRSSGSNTMRTCRPFFVFQRESASAWEAYASLRRHPLLPVRRRFMEEGVQASGVLFAVPTTEPSVEPLDEGGALR